MTSITLNNKSILVTGAAGFIGGFLVQRLLADTSGSTIIGIDNLNDYYDVSIKEWRLSQLDEASKKSSSSWYFVKGNIADKRL